jgi:hypothetical protein
MIREHELAAEERRRREGAALVGTVTRVLLAVT